MRTKIAATWITGYEKGQHTLIRDGVVVFEGNRIVHVGTAFDGEVPRRRLRPEASWWRPASSTPMCTPAIGLPIG